MESGKRFLWPWIVIGILVPVFYVASFGPACWLALRDVPGVSLTTVNFFYRPVFWIGSNGPGPARRAISWYMTIGDDRRTTVLWYEGGIAVLKG
jgi:hypothetical protein